MKKVARALASLFDTAVVFPTGEELDRVAQEFFEIHGYAGVVGIADGTHLKIQREVFETKMGFRCLLITHPLSRRGSKFTGGLHADYFYGRKHIFSFNILCIVDARMRIIYLNTT